jgi:predicted transposase/invertase (TIGR01784 family)
MAVAGLLDPKLDVVFKMLFAAEGNRPLLCALLSAVLEPIVPITDVFVLNPEVSLRTVQEKGAVLDVRARLADGRHINVEMQTGPHAGLRERALFYWAKIYSTQLQRGDDYRELAPTISIFILDFVELSWGEYHSVFSVLERQSGRALSDGLSIHVLQLPKLPARAPASAAAVLRWGRFFAAESAEELEELAMSDPNLREAKQALESLSADPTAQRLAEERELWAWNYQRSLHLAQKQGEARGEARAILTVLESRGLIVSEVERERILTCGDPALLDHWLRRALQSSTVGELFS